MIIKSGNEPTCLDIVTWVKGLEKLGAGDISFTDKDAAGAKEGYDLKTTKAGYPTHLETKIFSCHFDRKIV